MARPTKAGLDYFELDCQLEEKVRLIQAEFGLKGFAVLVKLYQKIYGGFGYYCEWNEDSLLLFMSENGLSRDSKNLISEIVSACIRRNIFSEKLFREFGILTSEGVQKRYLNATVRRERVELKKEYLLISVDKNNKNVVINSINANRNEVNVYRNQKRRVEESRGENKENTTYSCSKSVLPTSEPFVISLVLNDKSLYSIFQKDIDEWQSLYPAVDILQELRKMKGWCDSNPTKRKTSRGIKRFINSWLSKEQDRGGSNNGCIGRNDTADTGRDEYAEEFERMLNK